MLNERENAGEKTVCQFNIQDLTLILLIAAEMMRTGRAGRNLAPFSMSRFG